MPELKVGGEVDAFCTRCKMVLAHTVLAVWAGAIKRVRCNTCMGEHVFRRSEPSAAGTRTSKLKPAPHKQVDKISSSNYELLLAGKERSSARRYNVKEQFVMGDLVEHPAFGLGIVAAVRGLEKIDVAFPGTVKTLLHHRGAGPALLAKPPSAKTPEVEMPDDKHTPDPAADTSDES